MLELNHGFCIESDENQFILRQAYIGKTKDGEPKEAVRTIGYYAKLQQALEGYINQLALNKISTDVVNLRDLLAYLKQEQKEINKEGESYVD